MDNKRGLSRLGAKLVGVSILGLALAFAVFYLVDSVVLPRVLFSERFASYWLERDRTAVQSYQEYVTEHGFTVQQAVEDEAGRAENLSAGIYTVMVGQALSSAEVPDEYGLFAARGISTDAGYSLTWTGVSGVCTESAPASSVEFVMEMHEIQCADGILFVSTTPASVRYAGIGRVAGLLLALLAFCAVTVPCIVHLVRRIGILSRETGVLMAGDLDHGIHMRGRDELSGLGDDIERLRQSVLARLEGEREAVRANSRLITTLSHDLRTPLTKLTAYLDILSYRKYQSPAEHDEFLRLASEKAAQIKSLTDQLFASAQVNAPECGLEQPPELVDGAALLGQLLAEQCDDLRRQGFDLQPPVFEKRFSLYLQTADAVRVFDNLFSNLKKYADPSFPIDIQAEDAPETVTLRIRNHALPAPDRADSHGLGVPAMRELMSRSGGRLKTSWTDNIYTSALIFQKHRESR